MSGTMRAEVDESKFESFASVAEQLGSMGQGDVELSLPGSGYEVLIRRKRPITRLMDNMKLVGDGMMDQ